MSPPRAEGALNAAAALAWAFAVMPAAYATGRVVQRLVPGDPSFVLVAAIAVLITVAAFVAAFLRFAGQPETSGRRLGSAVIISAAVLVVQGVLLP